MGAQFASNSGLLVAAKRRDRVDLHIGVHPHRAGLQSAADTMARATSRVQTAAASPYCVSLACRMASSSSLNGITAATGPKISSCAIRIPFFHVAEHGWFDEEALFASSLTAGLELRTIFQPDIEIAVHAIKLFTRNQRPHHRLRVKRIAERKLSSTLRKLFGEFLIDGLLDENARTGHANLT